MQKLGSAAPPDALSLANPGEWVPSSRWAVDVCDWLEESMEEGDACGERDSLCFLPDHN